MQKESIPTRISPSTLVQQQENITQGIIKTDMIDNQYSAYYNPTGVINTNVHHSFNYTNKPQNLVSSKSFDLRKMNAEPKALVKTEGILDLGYQTRDDRKQSLRALNPLPLNLLNIKSQIDRFAHKDEDANQKLIFGVMNSYREQLSKDDLILNETNKIM